MGTITFESPIHMIGAGFGLLILGLLLLDVGIGFIGAIFGIWWIGKGIWWQIKITSNNNSFDRTSMQLKRQIKQIDDAVSRKDFNTAASLPENISRMKGVKPQFQQQFIRDAALYSVFANDLYSARRRNADSRFRNQSDPDYYNLSALISFGEGDVDQALNLMETLRDRSDKGRFYDISRNVIFQGIGS